MIRTVNKAEQRHQYNMMESHSSAPALKRFKEPAYREFIPCECDGCRKAGQRHHIVFRSHGGMDITLNYKYLCAEHHIGSNGVHRNHKFDLELKRELQKRYYSIFDEQEYMIEQIAKKILYDKNRLEKRFNDVKCRAGLYEKENIIRKLMGGRLY